VIAPWLSVADATAAVAYYQAAFEAEVVHQLTNDEGGIEVAELDVAGAHFWVQCDPDADTANSPVRMILTVDDPDTAYARAIAAGATEVFPVYEGHGWRVGRLADPAGHHWELGMPTP
jgi:PhnB protein